MFRSIALKVCIERHVRKEDFYYYTYFSSSVFDGLLYLCVLCIGTALWGRNYAYLVAYLLLGFYIVNIHSQSVLRSIFDFLAHENKFRNISILVSIMLKAVIFLVMVNFVSQCV